MSSTMDAEIESLKRQLREAKEAYWETKSRYPIKRDQASRTTFEEYIRAWHAFLSKPLSPPTEPRPRTWDSIKCPQNEPCPTLLKPWTDFPVLQQQLFERIYEYIPQDAELFSSIGHLSELGQQRCSQPLARYWDLKHYQDMAVDYPVACIISYLQQIEKARHEFDLGDGITFQNYDNNLSDDNKGVQQSLEDMLSEGYDLSSNPEPRSAGKICIKEETDGTRTLLTVLTYNLSHELSVFNLRAGLLRADKGSMNILEDVINRTTIPTHPEDKFMYRSEWLTAAALTRTYACMVETGLEYGQLITEEVDVFLWLKEDEPHTLYYHLADPTITMYRTALSQTVTFYLTVLKSKPRNQKWRHRTLEAANRVVVDPEVFLQQISAGEEALNPPPSVLNARIHPYTLAPTKLNPRSPPEASECCGSGDIVVREDSKTTSTTPEETSDVKHSMKASQAVVEVTVLHRKDAETPEACTRDSGAGKVRSVESSEAVGESNFLDQQCAETPSKSNDCTSKSSKCTREPNTRDVCSVEPPQAAAEPTVLHRQYCTQACLLGLVWKEPLDEACPNVGAHRAHGPGDKHAISWKSLARRLSRQLDDDPDACEPLGKQGSYGALFRLTLEGYGYTIVAKGTVTAFENDMEHEARMYQRLEQLQGEIVPVYLGNIYLSRPYFLDVGVRIVQMLLMSWGGDEADEDTVAAMGRDLTAETNRAIRKLLKLRIMHGWLWDLNVLWNPETANVMLVDFERSWVLKPRSVVMV